MRHSLLCVLICLGCGPSNPPTPDATPDVPPGMMDHTDATPDMEIEDPGGERTWAMRERTETSVTLEVREARDDLAANTRTLLFQNDQRDIAWGPAYAPRHTIKLGSIIDPVCGPDPMPVQWLGEEEETTEFPAPEFVGLSRVGGVEVTLPNDPSAECIERYETELTLEANVQIFLSPREVASVGFGFHASCIKGPGQPIKVLAGANLTPRLVDDMGEQILALNVDPLAPTDLTIRAQRGAGLSESAGLSAWLTPQVAQRLEVEDGLGVTHTFEVIDPETPLSYAPPRLYWPGTASLAKIFEGPLKERWGRDAPYLVANLLHLQTESDLVCLSSSDASTIAPPQVTYISASPEVCDVVERTLTPFGDLEFLHQLESFERLNTDLTRWPAPSGNWLQVKTTGECRATLQVRSEALGDQDFGVFVDVRQEPPQIF